MRGADDFFGGVSMLTSCHLCLHVVLSVPQYHLFSSTTSQRRGTDSTVAIAVFSALYGCKYLLPSVACYFSPFLTSPGGCCIFAVSKNRPLPSPLCPSETGGRAQSAEGVDKTHSPLTALNPPPPLSGWSSVAQGSAPLMRYKMTFSHFSKDLIRPLSQREKVNVNAHYSLLITHYSLLIRSPLTSNP